MALRNRFVDFLNHNTWGCVAVGSLIAGALIFAQPAYHVVKRWRSEQLLEEADRLYQEKAYRLSFFKAHAATLLDNQNIDAARFLAERALEGNHPHASKFWELVLSSNKASPDDWKQAVDASLKSRDLPSAFDYLLDWEAKGTNDTGEYAVRKSLAHYLAKDYGTALQELRRQIADFPTEAQLVQLYFLTVERILSPEDAVVLSGQILDKQTPSIQELLWVARSEKVDTQTRLSSLKFLLDRTDENISLRIGFLTNAAQLGWPPAKQRLLDLQSEIELQDQAQLEAYTSALCRVGAYPSVLQLFQSGEALPTSQILKRNRLIASIEGGETDEAFSLTARSQASGLNSIAEESLIRALAFRIENDEPRYQRNLNESVKNAQTTDLVFLEEQYKRIGSSQALLALFKTIGQKPELASQASIAWMKYAQTLHDETALVEALDAAPENWLDSLDDESTLADCLYWSIVYGKDAETTRRLSEKLAAEFSYNPDHYYLLAFAYWANGQQALAKQLIETLPAEVNNHPRSGLIASIISDRPVPEQDSFLPGELAWLDRN